MTQPSYEDRWDIPDDVQRRFDQLCNENGWTSEEVMTHLMLYAIKTDIGLAEPLYRQRSARRRDPFWFREHSYFAAE